MASKEYYDIAYGLRDLAKELNRSDVINTIDSEIKKMKFDELGKNINYSYKSKTSKNKEENKDKYKPSKKKTILATEKLEEDNYLDKLDLKSNGIYSINKGWLKHPVQQEIPNIDVEEFEKEFKVWEDKYFGLLDKESGREEIDNLIEDIYNLRKEGMEEDGEYSIKNLIFKEFRNLGYLDNLKELRKEEVSKELSLEQLNEDIQD